VPRWHTLLIAASPALCVSAVSAMTDVPFLLLCALAWGQAARGRNVRGGWAAGLAALTKYLGLLNVALLPLLLRRPLRERVVGAVVATSVFGTYCAWNLAANGDLHVRAAARFQEFGLARQLTFAASFVASLGLLGLPAALGLLRWSGSLALAALLSGVAGVAFLQGRPGSPVIGFVAFGAGGALLWAAARASRQARDPFLRTAFWAFALYSCVFVYFGTARYLLPMLPLLLWLLVTGGLTVRRPGRWRLGASVAGSALLSVAALHGDRAQANAWRQLARELPEASRGFHTGRWGFAWYAGERGYRPLAPRESLREGDLVAQPSGTHVVPPTPAQAALLAPRTGLRASASSLRVMDAEAGAGFYSSFWGVLPLGWRPGAEEQVSLSRPDPEILASLARPVEGPVVVDLGSPEAGHLALDGWSTAEAFSEPDGTRRSFAWAIGPESALRVPLPTNLRRLALRVAPAPAAVGLLRIAVGLNAHAVVDLSSGWRSYEAAVVGTVPGGVTDVVLRPAGHERPGLVASERRELALAVDYIVFGEGDGGGNRGVWPIRGADGRPRLFVSRPSPVGSAPPGQP
jgi:hypothetical protein